MAGQKDKVVLAYSGGLDTSVCIKWLQEEKGLDVIAVVGDVGQEHEGLEKIKQKALKTGALDCVVVDMRDTFAKEYLAKALAANALYENKYPLVSALSRPLISKHLVDAAHKFGAKYIAHGCTGKGNDQVRFEASITMLDPDIEILAPVREWDLKTRPEEIEWAQVHGGRRARYEGVAVLHRRQPVGSGHRMRRARGSVDGASGRHLHDDGRSREGSEQAAVRRAHVRPAACPI